jgi:hypothetical protein
MFLDFFLFLCPRGSGDAEPVPDLDVRRVAHARNRFKLRRIDDTALIEDGLADVDVLDCPEDKISRNSAGGVLDFDILQKLHV